MSQKDDEKIIGENFIEEYNKLNGSNFKLDTKYLFSRKENDFPDLRFINGGILKAEVVRAVSEKIEKLKSKYDNFDLIEVDPSNELFIAAGKKNKKHYCGAENIILLIHLPFYSERNETKLLVEAVRKKGYTFKEIWAVWDDKKNTPIKLA